MLSGFDIDSSVGTEIDSYVLLDDLEKWKTLVKNTKDSLGVPLIKDPYINKTLIDLDLEIEAARLVAYEVAYEIWLHPHGP